jgi:uncharacterized membrane protein
MAAGYGFGALLLREPGERRKGLLRLGIALTLAFIVIRAANFYGDPRPWSGQESGLFTFFSFINCWKYPPSLLFLLMTLGPAIAALVLFERWTGPVSRFFIVFGRVPLFYYLLHIPLIHILAIVFYYVSYGQVQMLFSNDALFNFPGGFGYSLPVVYLVWIGAVMLLYPACRWFANVKRRRRDKWLSYL